MQFYFGKKNEFATLFFGYLQAIENIKSLLTSSTVKMTCI